ncbi:sodium-dependent bicarbonate transport family permease (plasmid) [Acaryochloris sp. 'Moss Beach']|uniref:sodium-dependent bicarbonate transport family permease n=1 Tax=Acaryochloris TaxID=155977 RepID=UPI001BAF778C|nr:MULTISPECIES: sodium-dependent bicarbonate transport family permease [Acaryochloris]QUY45885.1 sodium-dependent bicarbonate transport family permease [Acaryochloris marina S15]UJB72507.1 sodium-dependent bicarbonate transport family permease [Acaryochloris sp. 'Moss Beach']
MDFLSDFMTLFLAKLQSPTLGFLIGGMVVAAVNSRLQIPDAIYKFIVFMLLLKVGLSGGIAIRNANLAEMLLPAVFAMVVGILIVFIGRYTLAKMPNVKTVDAIATAGLFGAVSGSTLAAALTLMETEGIQYEPWAAALYPFMDIPALVTAIVLASVYISKQYDTADEVLSKQEYLGNQGGTAVEYRRKQRTTKRVKIWPIVKESLQGSALSALLLGLALGILTRPESVYESFFNPLFRGLLSILMLVMGMEATARIGELRKVGQWYALYAAIAPLLHGLIAFGFGMIAHYTTGFSPGGCVILAVIAASSSDISGPPTLRAGIPSANPSAYIGSSTAVGTPVALALGIPLYIGLAQALMGGS